MCTEWWRNSSTNVPAHHGDALTDDSTSEFVDPGLVEKSGRGSIAATSVTSMCAECWGSSSNDMPAYHDALRTYPTVKTSPTDDSASQVVEPGSADASTTTTKTEQTQRYHPTPHLRPLPPSHGLSWRFTSVALSAAQMCSSLPFALSTAPVLSLPSKLVLKRTS